VVFGGGGVLGLSCRSTPNVGALTVPADSTVRVVNRTGHSAKLRLGGTTRGTVPDDGSTDVVFRRGTTAVHLSPNCALGDQSTPVLVTATPSASTTMPDPVPAPTDDNAVPVAPSDSATPSGGTALPDSASPASRPQRTTTGTMRPGTASPHTVQPGSHAASTAAQGMPQGGATTRIKTRTTRGTDSAPTFAGMPPGDSKTIVGGVPTLDLTSTTAAAPAAVSVRPSEVAAAEPVAAMEPIAGSNGSVGLLGAVAGICVIGVAAGAIRAIVSQRASRTTIA
jgi:hypothetical protein